MANQIRWASNKARVADRAFTIGRVEEGVISLMPDPSTGKFTEIELVPEPAPPAPEPIEWEIDMASYTETAGKRLIPVSTNHEILDLVVSGYGTVTPDWVASGGTIEFNTSPFAISITKDGDVRLSQPDPTTGLNPQDGAAIPVLTITSYRTQAIVRGVAVPSLPKPGIIIRAKGQTVTGDTIDPTITAVSPSGAGVPVGTPVTVTFSEPVQRGPTGSVTLWNETLNSAIETFDMATAPASGPGSVAINLTQATFTPSANHPAGSQVSIRFTTGSIRDLAGRSLQAVTGSTWSFTTQAASGGSGSMTPDIIVSSLNAILSTLDAWAADPTGTTPPGKAPLDRRIIGYNANLTAPTISGKTMPMEVYIRPVGTFGTTQINGWNEPSCSVWINGPAELLNCANISWWRCDVRAPSTATFTSGILKITNCTNCWARKSVVRGWPHQLVQGTYGTTQRGVRIQGGTNCGVDDIISLFIYDASLIVFGAPNGLTLRGIGGRHSGGNVITLATGAVISDLLRENCFQDRVYHPYKSLHGDDLQYNAGAITHRFVNRRNISYRGHWTGSYNANTNGQFSNVTQTWFSAQGGSGSTGPNKSEQNIVMSGQSRGIDKIPGGATLETGYNTMIDSLLPAGQNGQSPFPNILASDVNYGNFITKKAWDSTHVANVGTGGFSKAISQDHHEILDEHMAIPTDLTDLFDVRPRLGTVTHPSYATPSARVGAYDTWGKLLLGDAQVVASKRGWPVATVWKEDFDPQDRFISGYTGTFDADGENA